MPFPFQREGEEGMKLSTGEKKERKREEKPAGFCSWICKKLIQLGFPILVVFRLHAGVTVAWMTWENTLLGSCWNFWLSSRDGKNPESCILMKVLRVQSLLSRGYALNPLDCVPQPLKAPFNISDSYCRKVTNLKNSSSQRTHRKPCSALAQEFLRKEGKGAEGLRYVRHCSWTIYILCLFNPFHYKATTWLTKQAIPREIRELRGDTGISSKPELHDPGLHAYSPAFTLKSVISTSRVLNQCPQCRNKHPQEIWIWWLWWSEQLWLPQAHRERWERR